MDQVDLPEVRHRRITIDAGAMFDSCSTMGIAFNAQAFNQMDVVLPRF
jgi:hypothetical protein